MPETTRKLTAIVFTDIAGFTQLSAHDEAAAVALIEKQRELLKPIVEEFEGNWLKEIGDGLLLSFPSSLKAVHCAIKIQETVKGVENLNLRIGIHQGDIIEKGKDILGDDVNIASRIEPFAAVGGVAISDKVHRDISGTPELTTKLIGKPKLKGVKQEVKVYCITSHGLPETRLSDVVAKLQKKRLSWVKATLLAIGSLFLIAIVVIGWYIHPFLSLPEPLERHYDKAIAVLYLDNMGAAEDQYFADGLTEELITRLARISNLKVASRTDVGIYRVQPASIQQIRKDMNVDYVVEGSVRKAGNQIRITAQLIKAVDGFHLWSETYDRELKDIFALQDDVATSIASKLDMVISRQDQSVITQRPTDNLEAYDAVLKAKSLLLNQDFGDADQFHTNTSMLERAIQLDPAYSDAHAALAGVYMGYAAYATNLDTLERIRFLEKASLAAEEALALDPTHEYALTIAPSITGSRFFLNLEPGEFEPLLVRKMMLQMRKLFELYPESPWTHYLKSFYYVMRSQTPLRDEDDLENLVMSLQKALDAAEGMLKVGYNEPSLIYIAEKACLGLGSVSNDVGDYEKALEYLQRGLEIAIEIDNKTDIWEFSRAIGIAYRGLDLYNNSLEYLEQSLEIAHELGDPVGVVFSLGGIKDSFTGLSLTGIGHTYTAMDDYEKALHYYEQSLEIQREIGKKSHEGVLLHCMGEVSLLGGNYPQSSTYFDSATKIWDELDNASQNLWTMSWWALADLKSNNTVVAKVKADEVEKIMESTDPADEDIVVVNWNLSQVYSALGDSKKGKQYLEAAYERVLSNADRLEDQGAREIFLTNIRENREVVAAWNELNK